MTLTAAGRKAKGDRAEREVLAILRDVLGDHIVRTRLEGDNDHGDFAGLADCAVQCKSWVNVVAAIDAGLKGAAEQKANAGLQWGAAWIRRRGGKYVVVMTADDWLSMYREAVLR